MAILRGIKKLVETWAPKVAEAFRAGVAEIRARIQPNVVAAQLQTAGASGAAEAINLSPVMLRALDAALEQAFEAGGTETVQAIPAMRDDDGGRIKVLFDIRSNSAERWLRDHSATLVREILDDQRAMIRAHLVAGMEAGRNPRDIALDLVGRINRTTGRREGGVIGLTAHQAEWVRRYADELAAGDPAALTRQLRDHRFDDTVRRAIESGKPLDPKQIARMVAAYEGRALRYRGETIALTETTTALEQARAEAIEQAITAGQAEPPRKTWRSSHDDRVRHTHRSLDGVTIPFRAAFVSSGGVMLRYPGDARATAAERIGCRCHLEYRF